MRYATKHFGALAALLALASCGSNSRTADGEALRTASSSAADAPIGVTDDVVKLGAPYAIAGTTFTPVDSATYDDVGYASQYGSELAGQATANGEIFNPNGASAAHKTLPMPSYVEVTALDTGRTILVRINDRGPFAADRLIDLSEGAARQLGLPPMGVSAVRVRRVNPPEQEKSVLRQGLTAAERIETPGPLLKVLRDKLAKLPRPVATASRPEPAVGRATRPPVATSSNDDRFVREGASSPQRAPRSEEPKAATTGSYVAQIAAFSTRARADALARRVGASVKASPDGRLYRVRFGPFATEAEAAAKARQKGYSQPQVYRD